MEKRASAGKFTFGRSEGWSKQHKANQCRKAELSKIIEMEQPTKDEPARACLGHATQGEPTGEVLVEEASQRGKA